MTAHRADRAGDSRSHGAGCRQEPAAPPAHGGSPPVPEPSARQSTTRRGSLWRWALVLLVAVAGPRRAMCQVPDKGYPCGNHTAGREGSLLQFSGNSTTRQAGHLLMHTGGDSAFYASTFTVQLFAKFTTNKIDQAAAAAAKTTLIGNFNGNSGWRVECWSKKCCLVAILRQINGQQQVCTDNTRGEEITSGRWFQLTARYDSGGPPYDAINGRRGRAAIFVNGIKHNEVEWGNVGRGALRFQNAPFAIGGTFGDGPSSFFTGMIDEVRLWNSALTDAEVLDTAFEIGWQWPDASGACASTSSPATPYSTNYSRIASVTNLTTLVLYVKDPSADTVANQNIRGQPWINASAASDIVWSSTTERYIDQEPLLEVLPTSQGVLSDVFPRLTAAHYKSGQRDDVTVVVSQSGVTVLDLRVRDPNYDDVVSIRAMLDFLDPRMAVGCAREGIGTANMKRCGHPGENLPDVVGWHSFAGLAGYEGLHGEGSTVGNDVVVGQMLDADNVLGYSDQDSANVQLRRVQMKTQCRGEVNPASNAEGSSGDGLPGFLPPYSDVASRLHVRLVWAHRPDHDWWVPEEGFEYLLKVRSYSRYRKTDNEQAGTAQCPQPTLSGQSQKRGLCTTLKLGMHVQFSPEFVNGQSYPKKQQEQPHGPPYAYMEYGGDTVSDNAVRHDDAVAVAVGETLHFTVRAQDRNKGDLIEIRAREDPGLPPGHDDTSSLPTSSPPIKVHGLQTYPARSQLLFPASQNVSKMMNAYDSSVLCGAKCMNCASNYNNNTLQGANFQQDLSPPGYVDRSFTYKPREEHAGGVFKVCFYAESTSGVALGLNRFDIMSKLSRDLCVSIKVLVPAPSLVLPRNDKEFEAVVGCNFSIAIALRDNSSLQYDNADGQAPTPYRYVVKSTSLGSEACSSQGCGPIAPPLIADASHGLPRGMRIVDRQNPAQDCSGPECMLTWIPERGQELDSGYIICVQGRVDKISARYPQLRLSPQTPECLTVRVRKCQECVRQQQSLHSIARSLRADVMSLYLSNPFLERPEKILPGTVVSTGPVYRVRQGDYLEKLANRFLVTVPDLLRSNKDVELGNGTLAVGMQICVRAPVCEAKCKYGTECVLPQPAA